MAANYYKKTELFSSSLAGHCYTAVSSIQDSPCQYILQQVDENCPTKCQQFYIPPQKEKFSKHKPSTSKQSSIYELERRLIDLEEENFKLRKELIGTENVPTINDTQMRLERQSVLKQCEIKLNKQEELHNLEIWRLKEDINNLTMKIQAKPQVEVETRENKHCPICSNGQVVDRMKTMIKSLEQEHQTCLKNKKQQVLKHINIESQLEKVKGQCSQFGQHVNKIQKQLEDTQAQNKILKETIRKLQEKCKELSTVKTQQGANNTRILHQNAQLKLDLMKIKEQKLSVKQNIIIQENDKTDVIEPKQPSSNRGKCLALNNSFINQAQAKPVQNRRPLTSKNHMKVSFDLGNTRSPTASTYGKSSFQRLQLEKTYLERPSSSSKYTQSFLDRAQTAKIIPNRVKLAAQRTVQPISLANHHDGDTFRPRKYIQAYKYNVN